MQKKNQAYNAVFSDPQKFALQSPQKPGSEQNMKKLGRLKKMRTDDLSMMIIVEFTRYILSFYH